MAPPPETLRAWVVYARPERQWCLPVELVPGASVREAIERSGIAGECPELRAGPWDTGIFNRPCSLDDPVRNGDRIEIYRPLQIDPKEARRLRAAARR